MICVSSEFNVQFDYNYVGTSIGRILDSNHTQELSVPWIKHCWRGLKSCRTYHRFPIKWLLQAYNRSIGSFPIRCCIRFSHCNPIYHIAVCHIALQPKQGKYLTNCAPVKIEYKSQPHKANSWMCYVRVTLTLKTTVWRKVHYKPCAVNIYFYIYRRNPQEMFIWVV